MQNNQGADNASANTQKVAWVAGSTGLIGQHLLEQLCKHPDYTSVVAFVRSQPRDAFCHPKLSYFVCDWDKLEQQAPPTEHVDSLFCALGSTKKKTPDKDRYRQIDVGYPEAFGQLGKQYGARYYGLVSAHGAGGKAPSFYLDMKRDAEQAIRNLDLAAVAIARPSLLLGDRGEFRLGEKASEFICKYLPGNLRAIHARDVAAALIQADAEKNYGCRVLESGSMQEASQHG